MLVNDSTRNLIPSGSSSDGSFAASTPQLEPTDSQTPRALAGGVSQGASFPKLGQLPFTAGNVFAGNDGEVTKAFYFILSEIGPIGRVAVALFRAQKRSSAAKRYRRGRYRRAAYDVKNWSMSEVCRELEQHASALNIHYGWKPDPSVPFGDAPSWVLYVELPVGQVSFHSQERFSGPDYPGDWDGQHKSAERIIAFCDGLLRPKSKPLDGIVAEGLGA